MQTNQGRLNCDQRQHVSIGLLYTVSLFCRGNGFLFSLGSWISAESSQSKNKVCTCCATTKHSFKCSIFLKLKVACWKAFPSLSHLMEHRLTSISMRITSLSSISAFRYTAPFHSHSPPLLLVFFLIWFDLLYLVQVDGADWTKSNRKCWFLCRLMFTTVCFVLLLQLKDRPSPPTQLSVHWRSGQSGAKRRL